MTKILANLCNFLNQTIKQIKVINLLNREDAGPKSNLTLLSL